MLVDDKQLLEILSIGHDTSKRGKGLSIRDALVISEYERLREGFGPSDLLPFLRANRDLAKQWVMYGEDKRTDGGWWIREDLFEVGSLDAPKTILRFESLEQAVAEFVVRELDFWNRVNKH